MSVLAAEAVKEVSSNIQKIWELRHYSQDHIASKIGISRNGYSKIELGLTKISLQRLFEIAAALDVNARDLIELDQEIEDTLAKK